MKARLENPFLVSGYVSLLIDAANLKSAVRTARMHKSADFLRDALIPGGLDSLHRGDHVIVVTTEQGLDDIGDILE